jgi:hypothetical protein
LSLPALEGWVAQISSEDVTVHARLIRQKVGGGAATDTGGEIVTRKNEEVEVKLIKEGQDHTLKL